MTCTGTTATTVLTASVASMTARPRSPARSCPVKICSRNSSDHGIRGPTRREPGKEQTGPVWSLGVLGDQVWLRFPELRPAIRDLIFEEVQYCLDIEGALRAPPLAQHAPAPPSPRLL